MVRIGRVSVEKDYIGVEDWDMERMLAVWDIATRLGLAPQVIAVRRVGDAVTTVEYRRAPGKDMYAWSRGKSAAEVKAMTSVVRRALSRLHARGVLFGDLHPGNVIVAPDGKSVVFVDWDTARSVREDLVALGMFTQMLSLWHEGKGRRHGVGRSIREVK